MKATACRRFAPALALLYAALCAGQTDALPSWNDGHTDATREWAYDRKWHIRTLDEAWDEAIRRSWTIVDMQKEWKQIYP
jgi:hypothetical protein